MAKQKTKAAVIGLLDAIKSETFESLPEADIIPTTHKEFDYKVSRVDTSKCSLWKMANRLGEYIDESSCSELIESIKKNGQQIPVIARVKNNAYEIICGSRRLFACKYLSIPIIIAIVDIDDKTALLVMDAENRSRKDISPYERAIDYKHWIDAGIYKNYKEIQELAGIKKSWFSQLIALADLDPQIVAAFSYPSNLKQKWGYELKLICKKHEDLKSKMIEVANSIKSKNLTPLGVYKSLKAVDDSRGNKEIHYIKDSTGNHIVKIEKFNTGNVTLHIRKTLQEDDYETLIDNIKSLLE
jgi:ParB/RepB/Spo0J family partition protein